MTSMPKGGVPVRGAAAFRLAAALSLAAVGPAESHEFWLAPSPPRASAGDTVALEARAGEGLQGEEVLFERRRAVRLVLRGDTLRDLRSLGAEGDPTFARFVLPDDGGALLGYESAARRLELPGEAFEAYLTEEGLDGPLAERRRLEERGPGRERYARFAKAWISGDDPSRVTRPMGLPLEIVPLEDPARAERLEVRVLHRGEPLPGVLLRAWRADLDSGWRPDGSSGDAAKATFEARTGADGVASVPIAGAGSWLIACVHMVRADAATGADWESLWASLTFAREEGGSPERGP